MCLNQLCFRKSLVDLQKQLRHSHPGLQGVLFLEQILTSQAHRQGLGTGDHVGPAPGAATQFSPRERTAQCQQLKESLRPEERVQGGFIQAQCFQAPDPNSERHWGWGGEETVWPTTNLLAVAWQQTGVTRALGGRGTAPLPAAHSQIRWPGQWPTLSQAAQT